MGGMDGIGSMLGGILPMLGGGAGTSKADGGLLGSLTGGGSGGSDGIGGLFSSLLSLPLSLFGIGGSDGAKGGAGLLGNLLGGGDKGDTAEDADVGVDDFIGVLGGSSSKKSDKADKEDEAGDESDVVAGGPPSEDAEILSIDPETGELVSEGTTDSVDGEEAVDSEEAVDGDEAVDGEESVDGDEAVSDSDSDVEGGGPVEDGEIEPCVHDKDADGEIDSDMIATNSEVDSDEDVAPVDEAAPADATGGVNADLQPQLQQLLETLNSLTTLLTQQMTANQAVPVATTTAGGPVTTVAQPVATVAQPVATVAQPVATTYAYAPVATAPVQPDPNAPVDTGQVITIN